MPEISWERERRDSRRIGTESLGETKAAADGRRFLGGKEWGETAMEEDGNRIEYQQQTLTKAKRNCFLFPF